MFILLRIILGRSSRRGFRRVKAVVAVLLWLIGTKFLSSLSNSNNVKVCVKIWLPNWEIEHLISCTFKRWRDSTIQTRGSLHLHQLRYIIPLFTSPNSQKWTPQVMNQLTLTLSSPINTLPVSELSSFHPSIYTNGMQVQAGMLRRRVSIYLSIMFLLLFTKSSELAWSKRLLLAYLFPLEQEHIWFFSWK